MDKKEYVYDKLSNIIQNKYFYVDIENLKKTNIKEDLYLDSLDTLELILDCEKEFDIKIPIAEIRPCKTIEDFVNVIVPKIEMNESACHLTYIDIDTDDTDEIMIQIPFGKEIDIEKSDFSCGKILFKEKEPITYEDIVRETHLTNNDVIFKKKKIYQKLLIVTKYLNERKDIIDPHRCAGKYGIIWNRGRSCFETVNYHKADETGIYPLTNIYFKSEGLAEEAIRIMGDDLHTLLIDG